MVEAPGPPARGFRIYAIILPERESKRGDRRPLRSRRGNDSRPRVVTMALHFLNCAYYSTPVKWGYVVWITSV